ncbi:MAG: amino acid adenylation domain-containing protein [Byssovorax sp.]
MVPGVFVRLDRLPLTANGKVDRKALPAPEAGAGSERIRVAPRGPVEETLLGIFAEVLKIAADALGVHDSFFDLGGHSLLATQAISRVRGAFGVDLALRVLFEAPTVAELGERVEQAMRGERAPAAPPLERAPAGEAKALSFAQERLWFLDQLTPGDTSYNIPLGLQLGGALDVAALRRAIAEVIRRHEALRSTFPTVAGRPAIVVQEALDLDLPVTSLASLPEDERPEAARRAALAEAARPFDLARGPLVRAVLLELDPAAHLLVLTMHHIVSDGWSVDVLKREVAALYAAYRAGEPSPLPELPLQYADYAAWQRRALSGEALDAQLAYWTEALRGAPTALDLPADRPRPAVPTYRGARKAFGVSAEVSAALKALARRENVTLFMLLLAAFETLLHRYARQSSVLVGTPVAGRGHRETEGLIGFFVNTLVLRADFDDDPRFVDLLAQVREACLGAYSHADLPFERLVQAISPERDLGRTPLFQAMFLLQNAPREAPPGARRGVSLEGGTAKFDLTLTMLEGPSRLGGSLELALDLFEPATIDRMIGHFQSLLEGIARAPSQRVSELPMVGERERELLLVGWNATDVAYPAETRVHDLFEAQVERTPEAVAVTHGGRSLRYRELDALANRLAHHLIARGVGPDVLVGLCLERSIEVVVAVLGVLKAGGAYVPMDPSYPRERLGFLIEDSRVPLLLTTRALSAALPESAATVLLLDALDLSSESSERPGAPVSPADLCYVIYTSGSTGKPKGAMLEHRGVVNYLRWAIEAYRVGEGTGAPVHSSIGFDLTVTSLFTPLLTGGTVTLIPEELGVLGLAEALRSGDNYSLIKLTPSHLEALSTELASTELAGKTRALVIGGEALFPRHLQIFREKAPATRLINEYGPTETVVGCAIHEVPPGPLPEGAIPIGRPIANTRIYVLDAKLRPAPIGVAGEIYIAGAQVGRGYLNRPELSAERFLPDPFVPGGRMYRSGDLGRRRADGELEYLGRLDSQVKIRGYRIELGEIEAALSQHPAVREAAVLAREDVPGQKRLVAYVTAGAELRLVDTALRDFLAQKLPEHLVPAAFVILGEMPLTENGKIDRRALPAPESGLGDAGERVAARNEIEATFVEIWRKVLRIAEVGVHDNFFSVGGDSILSIQVVSLARQAGLRIRPQQIFRFPTIAGLASAAERIDEVAEAEGQVTGALPLTPIAAWWVERDLVDPHHFNQSVMLEAREPLDPAALEAAMMAIVEHHDALRLRLRRAEGAPLLSIAGDAGPGVFRRVDLSGASDAERREQVRAIAADVQASLDLDGGPVTRLVYFDLGPSTPGRLLWVAHHLAVDGVSWRILIDDLFSAYEARARGEAIALPPRTTSIKRWATLLAEHARSTAVGEEAGYWLAEARRRVRRLPLDRPAGQNVESSARSVTVALSAEHTESLLRDVPAVYGTQINDVLLAAFSLALRGLTGSDAVLFDLEGHGREDILPGVDLSRTVGWFTALFPVLIDLGADADPGRIIKSVKEQLRAIPNKGLGYGLLRYLRGDVVIQRALAEMPKAEVLFNYLGQMGQTVPEEGKVRAAREPAGPMHSPRAARSHLIEVNASIAGGRLQAQITYGEDLLDRARVTDLAERFLEALRGLIAHCLSPEAGGYTASDFQAGNLSQDIVDKLMIMSRLDDGDDDDEDESE